MSSGAISLLDMKKFVNEGKTLPNLLIEEIFAIKRDRNGTPLVS